MRTNIKNLLLVACAIGAGAGCKNDSGDAQLNQQANARGTTSAQPIGPDRAPAATPRVDQPGSSAAERGTATNTTATAAAADEHGGTGTTGSAAREKATGSTTATGTTATGTTATGTTGSASAAMAAIARDPAMLLQTLHKDGKAEIEAGKLAQKKGKSSEAKRLGADLVRDHQQADQRLMAYAKKHDIDLSMTAAAKSPAMREQTTGTTTNTEPAANTATAGKTTPPGMMDPMAMVQQLKSLPAAQFDQQFGQMMAMGHQQTIDLVTTARASAQDDELKALLGEILPRLQEHLQMAQSLGSSAQPSPDRAMGQPQGRRGTTR